MELVVRELTPELWPAVEDLFATTGPVGRCWCMYWRIGSTYRDRSPDANKEAFRGVVYDGPPPALLAFDDDIAVGWCQLTPRDALPALDRTPRLRRVDDTPVWSISCFYTRKGVSSHHPICWSEAVRTLVDLRGHYSNRLEALRRLLTGQ
jgi:hypothetical protein